MKSFNPIIPTCIDCSEVANSIPDCRKAISATYNRKGLIRYLMILGLSIFLTGTNVQSFAQSSTCVPGMVMNGNNSPWSEECYLNNSCQEQGNPCQANDVTLTGVYIADAMGNPVPACQIGDMQTVLLWGTFNNNTGTNRYAIRTRTEVWINGAFNVELNACSFEVLAAGVSNAALLGSFTYTCGDQIQLLNTWVGWETSSSTCAQTNVCGEYAPSKCSKDLGFIDFLTVNFDYTCGITTSTTTQICFTDLTQGGTPPYTYAWDFGDGGMSTLQNPCHTYNATTGMFTVVLNITDADATMAGAFLVLDLDALVCCNLTVTCPPANGGIFACPNQVPAANPDLVIVTDSCGPVTITVTNASTGTGCGTDTMRITRNYIISDGTNLDTCTQLFRVIDNIPPSFTCPAAVTVQCASLVPAPTPGSITATDNCVGAAGPTVTFVSDVTTNQTCTNRLTVTRTYRATDACGNSATCTQAITVFDNMVPLVTCPADVTVQCASNVPPPSTGSVTVLDNCGGTATVTVFPDVTTNQTCANRLTLTRVYRATDLCGNSATCAQTITVFDDTPPTIACPAGVTVQCASLVPPANPGGITATGDNCGGTVTVTVLPDVTTNQTCVNRLTLTRTYVATDLCGNTGTCAQTINVFDSTIPTLTCPAPVSVQCANLVPPVDINSVILESDNCGGVPTISFVSDITTGATCPNRLTLSRTYRATDECGNSATCAQTITVFDSTVPTITCPGPVTVQCASQVPPASTLAPMTSDNCGGGVTVTFAPDITTNQTCANRLTLTRIYTATDACNNTATCAQVITVFDNTPPVVTCPAAVTVQCASLVPAPAPGSVSAPDNCGGSATVTFVSDVTTNMTCTNRFTLTRTYLATDLCGNTGTCAQTITVFDNSPPTIICPAAVTVQCASLVPPANPAGITSASDNCGGTVTVTVLPDVTTNQTCVNRLTLTRTYVATDLCGNSATCNQIITVFDNTLPTLACPAGVTVQCASLVPPANPGGITATGDNCGGAVTVTVLPDVTTNQTCVNRLTITRTYVATDVCGNTGTCAQTITVFDSTVPTLTCTGPVTVQCAALVPPVDINSVTAESDNCGGVPTITFVGDVSTNVVCANRLTVTRTYRATDECGNSATCAQVITIFDSSVPTLTCPAGVTVQCASLVPAVDINSVTAESDNCGGIPTITHVGDISTNVTCINRLTVTRTYRATDECGNSATCAQVITIFDSTIPTLTCPLAVTVQCASQVPAVDINAVTAESDNCGGVPTITHVGDVTTNMTCANRFNLTRTYRATDECGNSATCTQSIIVFDNTVPTITCPAAVTVQCASLVPPANPPGITSASDNCGGTVTVTVLPDVTTNQTCVNRLTLTRTYRATDLCGNSATCTQTITVFDNTIPVLTCPATVTVQCASQVPAVDINSVTAESDNCGGVPTITHVGDVTTNMTCANRFNLTRTYRATDECGNSATCTQSIIVFDSTIPVLTCPASVTVQCASLVPAVDILSVTAESDNCGGVPTITFVGDVSTNVVCANRLTVTRTYRATDECGNSATCAQVITVFDSTIPTLTCPVGVTVQCASLVPAVDINSVTAESDNCGGVPTITHVGDISTNVTCVNRLTVTRTYRATDECGNSATCAQVITIFDSTIPTLTCPLAVTVQCASQVPAVDINAVTAESDNCGGVPTITHVGDVTTNMTCANRFNLTRTYRATDECGNSATCTQSIIVFDNTVPTITCPAAVTVQCASLVPPANPAGITSASDNCGGTVTVTVLPDVTTNQTCVNRLTLTRTYRATDLCGNSATCTQTITVFDNIIPVLTCPATVTVQCASQVPAVDINSVTAESDNCGGVPTITHVGDVTTNMTCANRFNLTRTYRATDECGNSATCTQSIIVFDSTIPVLTCPASVTVQCASLVPAVDILSVTAESDNCGGVPTITFVGDVSTNVVCANRLTVTRTYRATDECGNSATCAQVITVFDSTIPTLTCPAGVTVQCASLVPAVDINSVTAESDNCGGVPTITHVGDISTNVTCVNRLTVTRTYRATDECGNSATCAQVITIFDSTIPTLTCPLAVTVQCASQVPAVDISAVTAESDNCGGVPTITHVGDVTTNMTCANRFNLTRTYRATDECGNSATCTQSIIVFDNTVPTITCPAAVTVQCASLVPPANPAGITSASDNCGGTVTVTVLPDVTTNQTCVNRLTLTRTYRATDLCGNSATCTQTITVFDNIIPVLTCPATVTVQCASQVPPVDINSVTAESDNCGGVPTITHVGDVTTNMTCANRFNLTRTYRATDECGNSATCTQSIIVFDSTIPVLTCPASVTVQCASLVPAVDILSVTAESDNCGGVPTITHVGDVTTNMTCANRFNLTRTYRATDECGNSATCTQTIFVFDNTIPTLTCPAGVTVQCASLVPPVNIESVTAESDNCGGVPTITHVGDVTTNQTCANRFNLTRTYRATDVCGNSATCTQSIVVFDNTIPTLTCPAGVTVQCASQVPAVDINAVTAESDNCGGVPTITHVGDVTTNMTCANRFNLTRTYRATDECGNSATCTQTITVFDNTVPTLTCPAGVTVQCASQVPPVNIEGVSAESDNCGGVPTVTHVSDVTTNMTCVNRFNLTRTYRATDECGNSATCTQIITVFDNTVPVLTCPATVTVQCASQVPPVDINSVTAESDNCGGIPTITHVGDVTTNMTCANRFNLTRTYRATDECGNSATCTQSIIVFDSTIPVLTCPASVTVQCANLVPTVDINAVTAESDNCGGVPTITHVSDVTTNQTCANRFNLTRTYRATDECGNSATCTQTIFVFDTSIPVLTCPAGVTVQCANLVPPVNIESVTAESDNCGGVPTITHVSDVTTNQVCANRFNLTRTYRATDECGNSATCTQSIVVFDNTVPTLTCPGTVTVQCASQVPAVDINSVEAESDNCGGVPTITHVGDVTTNMTCSNRFNLTRTYRATDECGNSATCTQTIIVFDNTIPTLTCPMGVTVQCASLVPPVNIEAVTAESDNCGGVPVVTHVSDVTTNQTCVNRFNLTRTYRATDECGNSATCTQIITVFDNTVPTLTCPANLTFQCANQVPVPNTTLVTAADNCGGTVTVTFVSDITTNQTCVNRFTLTRTYRATDACGNSATCAQTISVFDNTPPSITCPANITVQCANLVPPPTPASVITSDNCGGAAPTVTFVSDVTTNFVCINRLTLTRTYRSTDACGNSATCAQVITVFDNTPPVIVFVDPLLIGVPNGGTIEVQCFGQDPEWDIPGFGPGDVTVTDNCTGAVAVTFSQDLIDVGDCDVDGYINRYQLRWTATDACGNSSSATVFMELVDTIPPVILGVPDDITVSCDEIPEPAVLSATDECLCACVILMSDDGPDPGCQNGQVITRTWKATDDCGNMTIETQLITLVDDEAPVLTIMVPELEGVLNGAILEYTCNEGGIPDFFDDLSAESVFSPVVCGGAPTITFDDNIFTTRNCKFFGYIEQRIYVWTGIDQCGNTATLTITVHLVDDEAPVISGVPDMACENDPILDEVEATDNCDVAFLTYWDIEIESPCGNGKAMRRTYEAYDPCGNYVRDTVIVIPDDNVPPVITFVNPILADLEPGEKLTIECDYQDGSYTDFGIDDAVMEDDCHESLQMFFDERVVVNGTCVDGRIAILILQWTAFDVCGNSSQRVVTADIVDHTAPTLVNFRSEVTIGCNDELPEILAADNCGTATVATEDVIIPGDCAYEYDVMRRVTATDACGNTFTALQTVHVGDNSGPIIEGVEEELCDDLSIPKVTAWDPCAEQFVEVTMVQDTLDIPTCKEGFGITRTWSATDLCGNVSTVVQTIILNDQTAPEMQIPTWSVIRLFMDNKDNLVCLSKEGVIEQLGELNESSITIQDDCDQIIDPVFTVDTTYSEDCEESGYYERRVYSWSGADACGNGVFLSFTIDICDDIPPVLGGIPIDTSVICSELPLAPGITVEDYAQPVTIDYNETVLPGEGENDFIVIRTWTVTDACGNVSTAQQNILWIPNTNIDCSILLPESVECNSHGVVIESGLGGGVDPFTYMWEVSGECFIQSGQGTPSIEIYVGFTQVEISLTVTDAFGCFSVCQATLDCEDPFDPFAILNPDGTPVIQPGTITPGNINSSSIEYLQQLNLWPNPASGTVNISFDAATDDVVTYNFTNFLGQVVLEESVEVREGHNSRKIDVSHLPDGTYLIQVKTEKEMHTKTLVIIQND